jgi:hypothetical protein
VELAGYVLDVLLLLWCGLLGERGATAASEGLGGGRVQVLLAKTFSASATRRSSRASASGRVSLLIEAMNMNWDWFAMARTAKRTDMMAMLTCAPKHVCLRLMMTPSTSTQ